MTASITPDATLDAAPDPGPASAAAPASASAPAPASAPGPEQLIDELGHAMQEFQRSLDLLHQRVADKLGLNRTDLRCLELLLGPTPLSPGELAKAAYLTTGGVTTAIDRLERAGYVTRIRDTVDRRRSVVQPTDLSHALAREIYQPIVEEGGTYLRGLDSETVGRLVEFLRFSTHLQSTHAARLTGER